MIKTASKQLVEKLGKTYKAGEVIFCEYEQGTDFYLISEGKVKILKVLQDEEKMLDILGKGEFFGEMSIIENEPRSATAVASEDSLLLCFSRETFSVFVESQPELALNLLITFIKRIYDAKRRLKILLLKNTEMRVMDVFLMLAEKKFGLDESPIGPVTLDATINEIANWCGENFDKVKQATVYWEKMGKIEVKDNQISLYNLDDCKRLIANSRKEELL